MCLCFRLKSVAGFRAELQYGASSSHVRQLAKKHQVSDVDHRLLGRFQCNSAATVRRLTPPITTRDLRHVPDFYSGGVSTLEAGGGGGLRSVSGRVDLRAAGLQDLDEAELWLARTLHGHVTASSEDDQTSKDDTEDELSK